MFAEEGDGNGSGALQQIVYRSAVPVTPDALDALCDKAWPARLSQPDVFAPVHQDFLARLTRRSQSFVISQPAALLLVRPKLLSGMSRCAAATSRGQKVHPASFLMKESN